MPRLILSIIIALGIITGAPALSFPIKGANDTLTEKVDMEVTRLMDKGDIPGLSLVIVRGAQQIIRTYGYADLAKKTPVKPNTLFELGSCSKAFTALAVASLVDQQKIKLTDDVSVYIPWLKLKYKGQDQKVTLEQLLHHTSGIPWATIAMIPQTNGPDALVKTVSTLVGVELDELPGKRFEYATINYDVLALVIAYVTKQPFETYIQENVIDRLHLNATAIGRATDSTLLATGYKIGFFQPRAYLAPVFKGNNAAGYVISNAQDIARWLGFQMGLSTTEIYHLAKRTQERDETVAPHDVLSYGMGWNISLSGNGEINHGGLNPNYTAYVAFRTSRQLGVAVLANSNSDYTGLIAEEVMRLYAGEQESEKGQPDPGSGSDKAFSILSLVCLLYILVAVAFFIIMLVDIYRQKRAYERINASLFTKLFRALLIIVPFFYGIYLLPKAMSDFTWEAMLVWAPVSFQVFIILLLAAIAVSYLIFAVDLCFPDKDPFRKVIPKILLMSILSGVANLIVIVMVTSALESDNNEQIKYLLFYYALVIAVYLWGRRFVQISLIRLTTQLIYDLRINLIKKILSTSYQKFEKIDRGRVYTALNDDVDTIGGAAGTFVTITTSSITGIGAFLYLGSIAFWAALLTIFLIVSISVTYYFAGRATQRYFEEARDSRNGFMRLINGMIDGFKEISMHRRKIVEYKGDVITSADEYRLKTSTADIQFANAFMVGEALLVILLGVLSFIVPHVFPAMNAYTVMSFVVVLLYLIGPVNGILAAVPGVMRLSISWKRIQQFLKEIPADIDLDEPTTVTDNTVEVLEARNLKFRYSDKNDQETFSVGPINLKVRRGEILFIVGGNGSGKTTLAKLLTGLYKPDEGELRIDNKMVRSADLSEYYSVIFSPLYLFEKLYKINTAEKAEDIRRCLEMLHLNGKVSVTGNNYSTINLSTGQRKRLALLQCYMEDAPICLFDEWAADQDPGYRHFFYRTLLPEMRSAGKIVIAITHDEHYFDVADKVLKMNHGRLENYNGNNVHSDIVNKQV